MDSVMISYLIGYLYAIFSCYLVGIVMNQTEILVDKTTNKKFKWQKTYVGIIERILYITALLLKRGELIVIWVGLKVTIPYLIWTPKQADGTVDKDEALMARVRYIDSL